MCRLYGFRANEPTKVECSLVLAQNALLRQSRSDLRGKEHADGWGIACYEDGEPEILRRETAAFETLHFSTAAERVFARTVVAHVRRATVSGASMTNTHPFVYGPWTFAHNGTVRAFDRVEAQLLSETLPALRRHRQGNTDSELAFLWLLTAMSKSGVSIDEPCNGDTTRLADVLAVSTRRLAEVSDQAGAAKPSELNFVLTDGHVLLASRWRNSLMWVARDGIHDCEICGIPHVHHRKSVHYRAAVVASEPISHEAWSEVPDGAVLVVDRDARATITGP